MKRIFSIFLIALTVLLTVTTVFAEEIEYKYSDNQVIVAFTDHATDLIYSGKLNLEKYFAEKNLGIEKYEKADYKTMEFLDIVFYILTLNKSDKDNVIEVCNTLETDENVMFASTIALDYTITDKNGNSFADNQLMVRVSPEEFDNYSGFAEKFLKELNLGIKKVTPIEDYTYFWDEMNPSPFDVFTYYISLDKHNCVNVLNVEKALLNYKGVLEVSAVPFISQGVDDSQKSNVESVYVIFTEEFTKKIIEGSVKPEEYISLLNLGINKIEYFANYGKKYSYELYLKNPTFENGEVVYHTLKTLPEVYSARIYIGTIKAVDSSQATQPTTAKPTVTPKKDVKKANPMKVTAKTKTVKAKKLKKSKVTVSAITVKNAKGKLSYKKLSGSKKLSVTKKGKITVKKGTKKGTYKLKVKITAKGNSQYLARSVTKTVRVKVK